MPYIQVLVRNAHSAGLKNSRSMFEREEKLKLHIFNIRKTCTKGILNLANKGLIKDLTECNPTFHYAYIYLHQCSRLGSKLNLSPNIRGPVKNVYQEQWLTGLSEYIKCLIVTIAFL
jgi:hypothetical protein